MMLNLDSPSVCSGLALVVMSCMLLVALLSVINVLVVRRKNDRMLHAESDKLNAFFESSPIGMVVFNQNREIVRLNSAAASLAMGEVSNPAKERPKAGSAILCANSKDDKRGCGYGTQCWFCPLRKVIDTVIAEGKPVRGVEMPMALVRDGGLRTTWIKIGAEPFMIEGCRHVIVAVDDVTENKHNIEKMQQAAAELERMNKEIQEASQTKGQFLANMSHEIRTPLNGIIGMTGLLMHTPLNDEQREFAETIRASGEALLVVVNDILDFSKIEANKMVLESTSFDLQHCLEEAVRLVAPSAAKKRLELVYQVDKDVQAVWIGDVGRLRQILVNLLGNAIKFTERGEVVVGVKGRQVDDAHYQLDFAVRDTGVGIPAELQDKLFLSFSQVDASATRRFGGTGLGLAISKRLCEMMGGSMSVESRGIPGQGSIFRFSIVVRGDADTKTPSVEISHAALVGKRILIVDDNLTSREMLTKQVAGWQMIPVTAVSGTNALSLLRSSEPIDVALLDFDMPDMNGLKLAESISTLPNRRGLRLLLLSPLGERVTGGSRKHIDVCLTKPVAAALLHDALVNAVSARPVAASPNVTPSLAALDNEVGQHHPLRILLAEDNIVNQKVAVSILSKLGYAIDVVADGSEVMDVIRRIPYDVILMDVQMPELDGEQATIRIRKELPAERQPWIVAMTANVLKGDRERYLAVGMNDYIPKPIRPERLVEALKAVHPISARATAAATPG